ncbi:hypothetical protein [Flavobacterium koreense]
MSEKKQMVVFESGAEMSLETFVAIEKADLKDLKSKMIDDLRKSKLNSKNDLYDRRSK